MMIVAQMLLIIGACLIYGVAADDGDDFSNNLFTDLGPYVFHGPSYMLPLKKRHLVY